MPKYWGKQIFSLQRFPEVGQKQRTEKRRRKKFGNNNGRLRIATPPRVVHIKPPGPIHPKISFKMIFLNIFLPVRVTYEFP